MKKFNAKEALKQPKRIMQYFGIWPEMNPPVSYIIRGLITFSVIVIAGILCFIQGIQYVNEGDYLTGSYVICCSLIACHESFKVWCLQTNKAAFQEILTNLEDPSLLYHEDMFDVCVQDQVQLSKKLFIAFFISTETTAVILFLSEYALGYNDHPRIFPIKSTDTSSLILYIFVWIYLLIVLLNSGCIISTFDGVVAIFLSLGNAQLQILQKEIVHALDFFPSDINLTKEELQYYNKIVDIKLRKCVKRHSAIGRYIGSINAKFSLSFLVQYMLTIACTGLLGLNIIFAEVTSPDFVTSLGCFVADLLQMFVPCYFATEIIIESESIRDACYMSNWMVCGTSVRKTLIIMMEASKRPFHITIGKFSIITLETFVIVFKTSMSYFTVLKNFYGDDPNLK